MLIKKVKRKFLLIAGSFSLGLGVIGIVMPVLPTTPFLLLTAYCYLRSSRRLYVWLISHGVFGAYIYSYMKYKAIKKSTRIVALCFLWAMLTLSMIIIWNLYLTLILLGVGTGVTIHLFKLNTLSDEKITQAQSDIRKICDRA
ncbi:MAG: YbaN family protein [Kosmotogaceae bacterium]